jgi:hypothetical protein
MECKSGYTNIYGQYFTPKQRDASVPIQAQAQKDGGRIRIWSHASP